MWIRGTKNKKICPKTESDTAHGKGRGYKYDYWEDRIHAAIGDGLLELTFKTIHACGLYKPQIAAILEVTAEGREVINGERKCTFLSIQPDDQQSNPKKNHRKSGGSNLIHVIEELLSSRSNWYVITETS